jgi:CheY-like chemotaxis protein
MSTDAFARFTQTDSLSNSIPTSQSMKNCITLIDDNEAVLKALTLVLKALGYSVSAFVDPLEAVFKVQTTHTLDVNNLFALITDVRMYPISGTEITKLIRKNLPHLPIILISGDAEAQDIEQFIVKDAFTQFLQKPFTPQELQKKLSSFSNTDSSQLKLTRAS